MSSSRTGTRCPTPWRWRPSPATTHGWATAATCRRPSRAWKKASARSPTSASRSGYRIARSEGRFIVSRNDESNDPSAETVLRPRERALAHLAAIPLDRVANRLADVGVLLHEARPQVVEQAEHVVRHQDLPVAPRPRADA